jgi:hypothetical protein
MYTYLFNKTCIDIAVAQSCEKQEPKEEECDGDTERFDEKSFM